VLRHNSLLMMKFITGVVYLNHLLACIFYLIGDSEFKAGRKSWLEMDQLYTQGPSIGYLYAFYWSLMTTTTIGYGDITPVSPWGRGFGLVAMVIGASVFAYGVTNVIELMSAMNEQEHSFRAKMDRISTYMSFRNLPKSLRSDVREFFLYTHRTKTERNMLEVEKEILGEMSPSLSHEVVLFVNRSIVDKVAFFRECDHRFFQRIVRSLEPATFAPNELVMKEGETGSKLYIISKGIVEILKGETLERVDTKADGAHFGMISIVDKGPSQGKRICSVRTLTYCDFRTISKRAFNRGLRRYPGVKEDTVRLVEKEFKEFKKLVQTCEEQNANEQHENMINGLPRSSSTESMDDIINAANQADEQEVKGKGKHRNSCSPTKNKSKKLKTKGSLSQLRRHSDMRQLHGKIGTRRASDLRDVIEEDDEHHSPVEHRSSSMGEAGYTINSGMTIEQTEQLSELMVRLEMFLDGQDVKDQKQKEREEEWKKRHGGETKNSSSQQQQQRLHMDGYGSQASRDTLGRVLERAIDDEEGETTGVVLGTGERAPPPPSADNDTEMDDI